MKKRIIALFVTITMMLSMSINVLAATTHTVDEAMSWLSGLEGTTVGSGQCVALISSYYSYLGVSPVSGNACDYATNKLPSDWQRVKGGIPQKGDILVYTGAKYGHVAIYAGGTVSYHQNMAGKYVEKKTSWNYDKSWYSSTEGGTKSYWGYIRPNWKNNNTTRSQVDRFVDIAIGEVGEEERTAWSDDIKYNDWYYNRKVSNYENKNYVGGVSDPTYAWCAAFVSWCSNEAGLKQIIPKFNNCRTGYEKTLPNVGGVQHDNKYTPQKGDIIFFCNSKRTSINHVGIVYDHDGTYVYYIDGNNTKSTPHNVANSKCALYSNGIYGYVTPPYTDGGKSSTTNSSTIKPSYSSSNVNNTSNEISGVFPAPLNCYTEDTNRVVTYYGEIGCYNRGYIDGYADQCTITKYYNDGSVLVKYPGVKSGGARVKLTAFTSSNKVLYEASVTSNQTVYRRSNLAQSIGTVSPRDTIQVIKENGNVVQIIYPLDSGGWKMGWIKKSLISKTGNVGSSQTGGSKYPVYSKVPLPIKAYTKSTGNTTTYWNINGSKAGYIAGEDLCTINEVYSNGWVKVTYPTPNGAKTAYTYASAFATDFHVTSVTKSNANRTVYRRSNLKESIGTVYLNDEVKIVGAENGHLQIIYPISGGYKMGWISSSYIKPVLNNVKINSEPITSKIIQGQPLNTNGLSVVANYVGGAIKNLFKKLSIFEESEEGYEIVNSNLDEVGTHTVAVVYEENGVTKTDSFNIEVVPREITSISLSQSPNKTTYIEGERLKLEGMLLTATYNDGTTESLTNYEIMVPDMEVGTKSVVIYSGSVQTSFDIIVKEKSLESIKLKTLPNKTTYAEGQSLDSTGLKLIASYNNGTTEEITSGFTCSSINSSYIGKQNVTVTYKDKTATFPITVIEKKPSSIEIVSNPTKTDVLEGIIDLDTTGMKVKVSYDNGSSETIETGFNLVGYEPRTLGKQTITANYCGFTDTFDINVKAKTLTEIKIAEPASVTEFIEGQDFASYGLVVHGYYDNGDINEISDYTISGYDNTVGTKTITIAYGGKTVSYNVVVAQKELECIDIESLPTKTEYLEDEELDTTELSVVAVYNNGDREAIALSDLEISGYDNAPGTKGINVSYADFSTVFDVTVKAMTLTSFTLDTKPTKTEYNIGEELDLAGLSMTAKYEHGRTETVDINDCAISGFDKDKAGIQVVVISYRGSNVAFVVNVKQIVEQTAMIRTKNVSAVNGSTIAVPVNIINNTGISNLELSVSYDKNVLTKAQFKASELLSSGAFNVAISEETDDFITQTITWSADSDMAKNGTIFTAYFTVSGDAVAGNYPIEVTYNAETTKNKEGKAVKLSCVDGSVDVAEGETIPYVISCEQATVQSGGLLNYEISLANNVGLSSYKLKVLYDTSALDIKAVKSGRLFGDFKVDYTEIDGGIEITGTSEGLNKQNGSFLTLEFTAAEGIENATYPISITCTENGNDATIECEEGSVAISGYVLGDINGDGRVNNFDVMMHVGYLSGSQKLTPEQLMAADVTGDGNVDYLDYSSISSYVVGIYEGLNSDVETMGSSLSYASNFVGGANSERAVITASEIFDAQPGEYITVDVDLSRNPGLSGYVVTMEYDTEALELIDIIQKDALSGGKFNTNTSVAGEATVMWSDIETHNDNGTIFSVTFKVGNDVPEELPLILTYNSEHTGYLDETYTSVPVTLMSEDGAIYIDTENAYMTLDNITNDGTNISGSVNIYNDAEFKGTADLFIATYDGLGKLVSIESQDVELTANETSTPDISISAKDAKTLKVFVFEKGSIRPLMKSKSKTF